MNANFWTVSKVRLAQWKLAKTRLFVSFVFVVTDCIPSLADELRPWTNGPRAQYLRLNRSQFVFYSTHAAISLEYQLRQLLVCLQTKLSKKVK